jgi:hypothetical protein
MQAMEHEYKGQGEKVFVIAVLLAIGVIASLTLVGTGLRFNWLALLLGLASCGVLMYAADGLYSGRRQAGLVLQVWVAATALLGVVLLGLVLAAPANLEGYRLPGLGPTCLMIGQCLMLALVGGVVFGSREVRAFLASRRGEAAAPATVAEVDLFVMAEGKPILAEGSRQAARALRLSVLAGALLLLGLAGVDVVGAIILLWTSGFAAGWWLLFAGVVTALLGQVLLTTAEYLDFLTTTKGYEVAHLGLSSASFQMVLNVVLGAAVLCIVLLLWSMI